MQVPSRFASPVVRWVGAAFLVIAVALGVFLVVAELGSSDDGDGSVALPGPVTTEDGWTVSSVGWAPGATALSVDGSTIRASDPQNGIVYIVEDADTDRPSLTGSASFGSLSQLDRATSAPDGGSSWAAEGSELVELDVDGEEIRTIGLDHPGSVVAVTDAAVWLTVSGVPVADETGVVAPRSVVQRVDTSTGEVVSVPVDDPTSFHLAVAEDAVWATVGSTLLQLDPLTVEPVRELPLDSPASALVVQGDEVLVVVSDGAAPTVVRIDAASGDSTDTIALTAGAVGEAAVVSAAGTDELWVLRPDADLVDRIPLGGGATSTIDVVEPRRIEVTDDGVWLLGGREDGLLLVARP